MSGVADQEKNDSAFAQSAVALFSGLLFGLGLIISGMVNPSKVFGFLDLAGDWDPRLIFVIGGGVTVTTASFWLVLRSERPLFAKKSFYRLRLISTAVCSQTPRCLASVGGVGGFVLAPRLLRSQRLIPR